MRRPLFIAAPEPAPIRQKKAKERPMPILVRRHGGALLGVADMDVELITRLDAGTDLQVEITQRRHVGRHRLYWALLTIVARNLPMPIQPEKLHGAVKLMLGVSVVVALPDGSEFLLPGSIAFDSMAEPEFRHFLDRFLDLIVDRLLPGVDPRALALEARAIAGPDPSPPKARPSADARPANDASRRSSAGALRTGQ